MPNLVASLSLDLDNKWSYLKTHGDPGWERFPSYLGIVVPRFLKVLEELNLKITVFVVGQDAALDENRAAIAAIAAAGHEIGNHSFRHEPWLHLYSPEELNTELAQTEEHLQRVTGQRPLGFRGPGFSLSQTTRETLVQRGYVYDGSTLPTFLGPLARAYYFFTARLSRQQKEQRKLLFGKISEGFRPLHPYLWRNLPGPLLEIPVTTMPFFRAPIHLSYLLYLRQYSRWAALAYFRLAMFLCQLRGIGPSLLLHPLDFLGGDDEPDLAFFPAMRMKGQEKTAFVRQILSLFSSQFQVLPMIDHARAILGELTPASRSTCASAST